MNVLLPSRFKLSTLQIGIDGGAAHPEKKCRIGYAQNWFDLNFCQPQIQKFLLRLLFHPPDELVPFPGFIGCRGTPVGTEPRGGLTCDEKCPTQLTNFCDFDVTTHFISLINRKLA